MNARRKDQKSEVRRQRERPARRFFFVCLLLPSVFLLFASLPLRAQEATTTTTAASPASETAGSTETAAPPARRFSPEGEPLTNLVFPPGTQQNIDLVLSKIKADTGIVVTPMGGARGQPVPAPFLKDATVENALKWIGAQKDWVWAKEGAGYIIADRPYYEKNYLSKTVVQRVIVPQNITAADAAKAVERMKSPVGDIQADPRTNQVIVTDLLPIVEAIERTIRLLDQKVFLRVFTLKHADPKNVLDLLQPYKSAPGRLELVPRMRQIIAEDTYENIQRMEVMVDLLDRGPEMRIYDLNNIDFEGKSVTDLQDYLDKEIITEGAYLKFDPQNGVMILIDLPRVHEKVQKILDAVDKPARQIYIQAEIVETNFDHTFKIGTDMTFADDLLVQVATSSGNTGSTAIPTGTGGTAEAAQASGVSFTDIAGIAHPLTEGNPAVNLGASGVALDYLSRHARVKFSAVMTDNETRVLAQPRVLVKNRQSADITDGGTISYPTTTYYGGGYGGGYGGAGTGAGYPYVPSVGSGSVPIGLTLTVDPSIMNNGLIELRVMLMNQSGTTKNSKLGGQDYTLVDTTNQTLNTILVIPDGQTRMIGGMIRNNESDTINGIPFLKDIPIIGPVLFGSRSTPVSRRTLLMFITPTVVQEKARKYVAPPDEDEKTPPTFFEQASWSAAAVKRAVEEAMKETESKYPSFPFPDRQAEGTKKATGVAVPTVSLEHELTTESAAATRPAELQMPVPEERVTTLPAQQIPPSVEGAKRLIPKMPSPPTSPGLVENLPPPRPTPVKKVIAPTTVTVETRKTAAPASPTPAPGPPAPAVTPAAPAPGKTPVKSVSTTRTLETRRAPPPTSPTLAPKAPRPRPPREEPTTATFPTTGTVQYQAGPPEVLLSARRPSDLPLPRPSPDRKARAPGAVAAASEDTGLGASSYEVNVLGAGGRAVTALPSGELRESPALGTIQIPMETLATIIATPGPQPPPGAMPGMPPGMQPGQVAVMPPGMRPTPRMAVTPLRPAPTAPSPFTSGRPYTTPYGFRPPIPPPYQPPIGPMSPYTPPGGYPRPRTR